MHSYDGDKSGNSLCSCIDAQLGTTYSDVPAQIAHRHLMCTQPAEDEQILSEAKQPRLCADPLCDPQLVVVI